MPIDPIARTPLGCPTLVGRAPELRRLAFLLDSAMAGSGTTVLLGGEAGIGKSRLCREVKREAAARKMRVIEGRCTRTRQSVAYGPFLDAIRFRLARGEERQTADTLAPVLAYLTPLFPELGASEVPASEVPVTQERAFEVIATVFQRLAALGPLLLVLEDLHWADPTSLDLLSFLADRISTVPLMVLGTYRSDELTARHRMRSLLVTMSRERLGHQMMLKPLGRDEVADMGRLIAQRELAPIELDQLWDRSQGNPFYVEELLGATELTEGAEFSADMSSALPMTIRDAVRARSNRLSPAAAEMVSIAAVIGRRFSHELLHAVSGMARDDLLACLAELIDHQLLVEEPRPDEEHYRFRHVLAQEALYADIAAPARRMWHARIAAAIEKRPEQAQAVWPEEIAHHYRLSGDLDCARRYDLLAGDGAARLFAWTAAEAHYRRALTPGGSAIDPQLRASVLDRLAAVVWWQSRPEEALPLAEQAVATSATPTRLRCLALLTARHLGDRDRALEYLRRATALLDGVPPDPEHARVMNDIGRLLAASNAHETETWLTRGLEAAQRVGDAAEIAVALAELGRLAVARARINVGLQRLEQARRLIREDEWPLERATAIYRAGVAATGHVADRSVTRSWLDGATAYASGHGLAADLALYQSCQARLAEDSGITGDVLDRLGDAILELRRVRGPDLGVALDVLGELHRLRGETEASLACFAEALALGTVFAAIGRTMALLSAGRPEEACGELEEALGKAGRDRQLFRLRALPVLVEAHTMADHPDAAADALARLEAESRLTDDHPSTVAARHAAGQVHAARGERLAARRALDDAVEGWRALGRTLLRLRAQLDIGAVLLAEGRERPNGAAMVAAAVRELDALGAGLYARQGRALLHRHGFGAPARPRVPPVAGAPRLTPRELEVLRQLARGSTNKEIARALDISERTAGVHVSHLLAKLGSSTRTQAVSYAIARGIVQPS